MLFEMSRHLTNNLPKNMDERPFFLLANLGILLLRVHKSRF